MDAEARWIVVGLGNPGTRYQRNRHNIGFMVVERLARAGELAFKRSAKYAGELAQGELSRRPVMLVKPQTFMNLSGRCVAPLARFYRVAPEQIVAVHDDVDLELGRLKVKQGGGDAGHNGLRSLTEELGSGDYVRVRLGVGRPTFGEVADYVLADFRASEQEAVEELVAKGAEAVRTVLTRGLKEAMNRHNRTPAKPKDPEGGSGEAAGGGGGRGGEKD
ncbi:MAG: aminoacyl-tRNA hydrolase [Deltaproteobacteria bacterium]|nr:aminoacyl-tRNA hydrolase [Deltaproteobacteria bacterium]